MQAFTVVLKKTERGVEVVRVFTVDSRPGDSLLYPSYMRSRNDQHMIDAAAYIKRASPGGEYQVVIGAVGEDIEDDATTDWVPAGYDLGEAVGGQ